MSSSIAVFVLLGSLALVLAFERNFDREERRSFEELARANVGFLKRSNLPQSAKMADQLGEIIGARVYFWQPSTGTVTGQASHPLDPAALKMQFNGKVHVMPNGEWMVGLSGRDPMKLVFLRPASVPALAMVRTDTWLALAVFWGLSLALGWGLARRVTRPLRSLAESLPHVGTDSKLPELPVSRGDEIGQLARTLTRTHESLRDERERRRGAERHALLGRMATSLAHEVRNPVTAIRLHAQLLEHAETDDATLSRQLIESEAERIEALVGQWLSYAKPAPPTLGELDVIETVRQAVFLMTPQAGHARVVIDGPSATAPVMIQADRFRMQQVLGNLLRNAIQAMPSGGRVVIAVIDAGSRVSVVMDDEGKGFSESALARLGEPFFSEEEGGMGLGLAVAKDICEAHGGSLTVENRDGGGARVRAEFAKNPNPDSFPVSSPPP